MLTVKVFDEDKKGSTKLHDHDYLGMCSVSVGQIMGSNGNATSCQIRGAGKMSKGFVALRAEEVSSCADQVRLQLSGKGLKNKDGWFGKSDPFLYARARARSELNLCADVICCARH
jgi:hypothetical protein